MRLLLFLTLSSLPRCFARGRCIPETRCSNSPDEGLTDKSIFMPPKDASSADLQLYWEPMQDGAIPGSCEDDGKCQCIYGHIDLKGSTMSLEETRDCPMLEDGYCGWSVTKHVCTCATKPRAQAAYTNNVSGR